MLGPIQTCMHVVDLYKIEHELKYGDRNPLICSPLQTETILKLESVYPAKVSQHKWGTVLAKFETLWVHHAIAE